MANNKDLEKVIDEMAIVSNELFSTAFDGRPDRAEFLVRDILEYLGYTDFEIISSQTQVRNTHLLQHDTITDIEVRLKSGELIIVEVEISHPERFTPKRGRFILGSSDVATLEEGMDYSKLPTQILIVISEKDLNDTGLPIAVADRRFRETGQLLKDEQIIVYVNHENMTNKDNSIDRYIHDLFERDYRKINNPIAREIIEEIKANKEGRMQYSEHLQKIIDEEKADKQKEINILKKENLELKKMVQKLQEQLEKQ